MFIWNNNAAECCDSYLELFNYKKYEVICRFQSSGEHPAYVQMHANISKTLKASICSQPH